MGFVGSITDGHNMHRLIHESILNWLYSEYSSGLITAEKYSDYKVMLMKGEVCDFNRTYSTLKNGDFKTSGDSVCAVLTRHGALMIDSCGVSEMSFFDNEGCDFFALGSGESPALAVISSGLSAIDAVKAACKVRMDCGGEQYHVDVNKLLGV
jgi:hypothetical protein